MARESPDSLTRLVWTPAQVVDVDGPKAMLRSYLEQRDVRVLLSTVCRPSTTAAACDIGCGFGRLTPVLTEFAGSVVAFEREPGLVQIVRALQPRVDVRHIESLSTLRADTAAFDITLVFTVLQHVPEPAVRTAIAELQRVSRLDGVVLLCEETDITLEAGDPGQPELGYTCGRAVDTYAGWMAPWELLTTRPREIEPGYPRADVGTYMVFAGPRFGGR
jgi:SAM-dependent methyltransferase